jgi:hypothetical protein
MLPAPTAVQGLEPVAGLRLIHLRTTLASVASDNLILWSWRFTTFSTHQPIKRGEIRARPALGEEGRRVHGRQLFGNCGSHKLIDADAIGLGAALDFRFH